MGKRWVSWQTQSSCLELQLPCCTQSSSKVKPRKLCERNGRRRHCRRNATLLWVSMSAVRVECRLLLTGGNEHQGIVWVVTNRPSFAHRTEQAFVSAAILAR